VADDGPYIITIKYAFEELSDLTNKATAAGKQVGDAFAGGFKPQIDLSKAFKKHDQMQKELEATFGKGLQETIDNAIKNRKPEAVAFDVTHRAATVSPEVIPPPPAPSQRRGPEEAQAFSRSLIQGMQPIISAFEAFAMLMRGAPMMSVLQMAGQSALEFQRVGRATGTLGETDEERIERRLAGRAAPVAEGAAAGAAANIDPDKILTKLKGKSLVIGEAAGAIAALLTVGYEADKMLGELGEKGANAAEHLQNMAKTMGITRPELLEMGISMSKAGVDVDQYSLALTRLAINAQQRLPAIQREVRDEAVVRSEAGIKVREADRGIEEAQDNRQRSAISLAQAEAEVDKATQLGVERREEARRGAELAVSGAQIGLRGAQMQTRQAAINLQFAPEEARLADIRGPQTVEGARLGRRGAGIGLEEAQARFNKFMYGEEEDPDVVAQRRIRKEQLALATARHNRDQADLREQEAVSAENKRQTMKAAGVGPEAQAEQQLLQAAQAEQQAKLNVQKAETAQKELAIDQARVSAKDEELKAILNRNKAQREVKAGDDNEQKARNEGVTARNKENDLRYQQIGEVQKALRGEQPAGYDIRQVPRETLGAALTLQGGGKPADIIEEVRKLFTGPLIQQLPESERFNQQQSILRSLIPGYRGVGGGLAGQQDLINALSKSKEPLTEDERKRVDELEAFLKERQPDIERTRRTAAEVRQRESEQALRRGVAVTPVAPEHIEAAAAVSERIQDAIVGGLKIATTQINVKEVDAAIVDAVKSGLSQVGTKIGGVISEIEVALRAKVQEIKDIKFLPPQPEQPQKPSTGNGKNPPPPPSGNSQQPTEAIEQQSGGFIHGQGSGTSDSIPIMASAGEYVIKADSVAKLGVGRLDALNEGRVGFAEGGSVDAVQPTTTSERQAMQDAGLDPDNLGPATLQWLAAHRASKQRKSGTTSAGTTGGGDSAIAPIPVKYGPAAPLKITHAGDVLPGMRRVGDTLPGTRRVGDTGAKQVPLRAEAQPQPVQVPAEPKQPPPLDITPEGQRGTVPPRSEELRERPASSVPLTSDEKKISTPVPGEGATPEQVKQAKDTLERLSGMVEPSTPAETQQLVSGVIGVGTLPQAPKPTRASVQEKIQRGERVTDEEYNTWLKAVGPKIGGWEPVLPPTSKQAPGGFTDPLGPGDYIIRRGGRGDQNYFGTNDYAIPVRKYPGGQDVERPSRGRGKRSEAEPTDQTAEADAGKQTQLAAGFPPRGFVSDFPELMKPEQPSVRELKGVEKEFEERQRQSTPEQELKKPTIEPITDDAAVATTGGLVGDLMTKLARGFAGGGLVGGFASHVANIPAYAGGGAVTTAATESGGSGIPSGFHQLDLRTDKGNFSTAVSEDTMEGIRQSSLAGKLSSTGYRPTWYS
jgi:hypothetical protein